MNHLWDEEEYDDDEYARARGSVKIGTITIEGNETLGGELLDAVACRFANMADKKAKEAISKAIDMRISSRIDEVIGDRIEAAVEAAMVEGWPRTDTYGRKTGSISMKDRIGEVLNARSYGRTLSESVGKAVEKHMAEEFKDEMEKAKVDLRAKFDKTIQEQLTDVLKGILGQK